MPLFSSRSNEQDLNEVHSRDSKPSASSKSPGGPSTSPGRPRSVFSRFRNRSSDPSATFAHDPTIMAARQKLIDAENAEKDVDRALDAARRAVREARQHVHNLEAAVLEEARRARSKQLEAKTMRKGADRLGRHDHT